MAGAGGSGKPATRIHLPGGGSLLGAVLGLGIDYKLCTNADRTRYANIEGSEVAMYLVSSLAAYEETLVPIPVIIVCSRLRSQIPKLPGRP